MAPAKNNDVAWMAAFGAGAALFILIVLSEDDRLTSWAQWAFLALVLTWPAASLRRWLGRRARIREFAATHQFVFDGTCASDKWQPYARFDDVRRAVLLYHVIKGRWGDFPATVFDYNISRNGPIRTAAIVTLPRELPPLRVMRAGSGTLPRDWKHVELDDPELASKIMVTSNHSEWAAAAVGPQTSPLLLSAPRMTIEAHFHELLVDAGRQIPAERFREFLDFAASIARALMADSLRYEESQIASGAWPRR